MNSPKQDRAGAQSTTVLYLLVLANRYYEDLPMLMNFQIEARRVVTEALRKEFHMRTVFEIRRELAMLTITDMGLRSALKIAGEIVAFGAFNTKSVVLAKRKELWTCAKTH